MRRALVFAILSFALIAGVVGVYFASADNNIALEATILGNASYTMIDVYPNSIDLGDLFAGQKTTGVKVNVTNLGNVNVTINFVLKDSDSDIWSDYLQARTSGSYSWADDFSFTLNSGNSKLVYFRLDLTNYTDLVYDDMKIKTNVTIRAVPQ